MSKIHVSTLYCSMGPVEPEGALDSLNGGYVTIKIFVTGICYILLLIDRPYQNLLYQLYKDLLYNLCLSSSFSLSMSTALFISSNAASVRISSLS